MGFRKEVIPTQRRINKWSTAKRTTKKKHLAVQSLTKKKHLAAQILTKSKIAWI
jgi:hypothetical protein